jgi:ribosome-binding protein aMBF1 (putative translation factor)
MSHRDILAARTPRTFSVEERQACSERAKGRVMGRPSQERIERQRVSIGRLTWDDVAEIRRLWENREMSQYAIAKKFGMSQSHISKICSGLHWVRG